MLDSDIATCSHGGYPVPWTLGLAPLSYDAGGYSDATWMQGVVFESMRIEKWQIEFVHNGNKLAISALCVYQADKV